MPRCNLLETCLQGMGSVSEKAWNLNRVLYSLTYENIILVLTEQWHKAEIASPFTNCSCLSGLIGSITSACLVTHTITFRGRRGISRMPLSLTPIRDRFTQIVLDFLTKLLEKCDRNLIWSKIAFWSLPKHIFQSFPKDGAVIAWCPPGAVNRIQLPFPSNSSRFFYKPCSMLWQSRSKLINYTCKMRGRLGTCNSP